MKEEILKKLEAQVEDLRELNNPDEKNYIANLQKKVRKIVVNQELGKSLKKGYGGIYIKSNRVKDYILIPMNIPNNERNNYETTMKSLKSFHWVFNEVLLEGTRFYNIKITSNTINKARIIYGNVAIPILNNNSSKKCIKKRISKIKKPNEVKELRQLLAGDLAETNALATAVKNRLTDEDFHYLMLATFLYTLSRTSDEDSDILIIGERDIGGVALITPTQNIKENVNFLDNFYRRFIRLIAMNESIYEFEKGSYYKRELLNDDFGNFLKEKCKEFIQSLILTDNIDAKKDLHVDENGVFSTKRVGNKREKKTEDVVVIRLYVGSNEAFNFLYHNNAANFAKIENYLNGVLHGYVSSHKNLEHFKKIRLDVYIAPKIDDISAMEINPIISKTREKINTRIEAKSNFGSFYENHKTYLDTNKFSDFKFILYLNSEIIGPSIFPAELVAKIARKGLNGNIFLAPVKIIDLFSGSGALAITVAKSFDGMTEKVNVLNLDINPRAINISSKYKKSFHTVQVDIFSFFNQVYEDETTFSNYDIVSADPHHFMVLDFLYKKVQLREKETVPFFNWLSRNTKVFILYFAHKEKESMGFFIHRIMSRTWPQVYSLLIGDEKIIIGTNFKDKNRKKFEDILKDTAKGIMKDYTKGSHKLDLVIFDSVLRNIPLKNLDDEVSK